MTSELQKKDHLKTSERLKALEYGRDTELLVSEYLTQAGYKILERNFRTRFGEVDIIALEKKCLVFIEIRGRNTSEGDRDPVQMLSKKKMERFKRASRIYLFKVVRFGGARDEEFEEIRFDFVSVLGKRVSRHIKAWQV